MFTRTRRRPLVASCLAVAVVAALGGCSLSGSNTSTTKPTTKTTLPRAGGSGASTSTFRTVPISPTTATTTIVPSIPPTDNRGNAIPSDGYTVKAGDTLSGIATNIGVSYKDLVDANPQIDPTKFLVIGQKLNVPTQSPTQPGGTNTPSQTLAPGPTSPTTTSNVQASGQTYTVVAGDYLIGIAKKLGVSLDSLLSVNSMTTNSLITPGMKLKVPKGGSVPKASATTTAAKTTTTVKK